MSQDSALIGKTVVICEDNGIELMQIRRAVTGAGMIVVGTTRRCLESVASVLAEKPDVLIVDAGADEAAGIEAISTIASTRPTCVIVITEIAGKLYGSDYDVSGYLVKPFSADLLIVAVRQALDAFYERRMAGSPAACSS